MAAVGAAGPGVANCRLAVPSVDTVPVAAGQIRGAVAYQSALLDIAVAGPEVGSGRDEAPPVDLASPNFS